MADKSLLKDQRLHAIFGVTLIAVMGVTSITPALPMIAEDLDLSKKQVGLLISVFTLPGIFLTPLAGFISDRWGRKLILVPALFLFALSGFGIFFAQDFNTILMLRVLQGAGAAPLGALNTALVGDFFKGKQLPQAMGYNASVLSLATASYPLLGGFLAGIAWNFPFVLPLLAIPIGLFLIFFMEEPKIEKTSGILLYFKNFVKAISRKEVVAVFILGTLTFIMLYGNFLTYLPFLMSDKFQLKAPQIGMMIALSSVATGIVASQVGKLSWKYGSFKLLKIAFLLFLVDNIMIPYIDNVYVFVLPIMIFGAAMALNMPSLQTTLTELAPNDQRGAFMSLNGLMIRLGQTIGPILIGAAYIWNDYMGAYWGGALVALVALIVLFTLFKKENQ